MAPLSWPGANSRLRKIIEGVFAGACQVMILAAVVRRGIVIVGIFVVTLTLAWSQAAPGADSAPISLANNVPGQSEQSLKPTALRPPNQAPDKLFDLPPLKHSQASMIGGSLESIDRVRSRFVLRPFGRGKLTIAFDPRTQFVRGAEVARVQDMHPGDRLYVETVLDGTVVFAKTVHLPKDATSGTALGQIIAYDAAQGRLSIRDQLSSQPVKFRVNSKTITTSAGLVAGALVQLTFLPSKDKDAAVVSEILVLAAPGSVFTFSGRITFLDLAAHQLVVANASDDNRYEIQFNPAAVGADTKARLQEGASVSVAARFTGQGYVAESVTVLTHPAE
jgi:hypothetical protein